MPRVDSTPCSGFRRCSRSRSCHAGPLSLAVGAAGVCLPAERRRRGVRRRYNHHAARGHRVGALAADSVGSLESAPSPHLRRNVNRVWTWNQGIPLRYALVDNYEMDATEEDEPLAACADVQGLFVDLPPAERERFTLRGCAPAGALRDALSPLGDEPAWFGNIVVDVVHGPQRTAPPDCRQYSDAHCSCMQELLDVVVVGHRPSALGTDLVDVDLDGLVRIDYLQDIGPDDEAPDADGFRLSDLTNSPLGTCREIAGLYWERPEPPTYPVTVVGCEPTPRLRELLNRNPRDRRVVADLCIVTTTGIELGDVGTALAGTLTHTRPSALGNGLLDITFEEGARETRPLGVREIWDLWFDGGPGEPNMWAKYDPSLRHEWCGAALNCRPQQTNTPAGHTYHLDGQYVTELEGFYCAIGEAINGPGGYFGWNYAALADCLRGGFGATTPFTLVWHHSDVARRSLVPGFDRRSFLPSTTLDTLLGILREGDVDVVLR